MVVFKYRWSIYIFKWFLYVGDLYIEVILYRGDLTDWLSVTGKRINIVTNFNEHATQ